MESHYITPTANKPVFLCLDTYYGYLKGMYKEWEVVTAQKTIGGYTWSLRYEDAVKLLFNHIKETAEYLNADSKFQIEMLDGKLDKYGDPIRTKVFSISVKQAIKFGLIKK